MLEDPPDLVVLTARMVLTDRTVSQVLTVATVPTETMERLVNLEPLV